MTFTFKSVAQKNEKNDGDFIVFTSLKDEKKAPKKEEEKK